MRKWSAEGVKENIMGRIMGRINVYDYTADQYGYSTDGPTLAGWFNPDSATAYKEDTEWDGHNNISVNPIGEFEHQTLYRTKGGRWVLNTWSQYSDTHERYEFINDDTAKDWLIRNNQDGAVEQWFGSMKEESGPNLGGRREVGPKVEVRLDRDTLTRVDERAKQEDVSRAEMLRRLIMAGLDSRPEVA